MNGFRLCAFAALVAGLLSPAPGFAQSSAPKPDVLARQIDDDLENLWKSRKLTPSYPCTDSEFLRRSFLDIVGAIPPEEHVRKFLAAKGGPDKRAELVENLLESGGYSRYAAIVWGNALVGRGSGLEVLQQIPFRQWLQEQFQENEPFDKITRQLMTASGSLAQDPAVGWALHHEGNTEEMTAAASRLFLGTQIECAQCHDHPFEKWKQSDFYGMAAFFARTKQQRSFLVLTIQDVSSGEARLGGDKKGPVVEPRFLGGNKPLMSSDENRREVLARWMTSPENKQFARAISNRVWAQCFGKGLVQPVDDFGESNPAVCPDALERLADGFIASGYDMKYLFRVIARTKAYQLSSRPSRNNKEDDRYFSKAWLRRQSPEQLLASVVMSTGIGTNQKVIDNPLFKLLMAVVQRQFIFVFATMDEKTEVSEFDGTISQALLMMNSTPIARATDFQLLDPMRAKLRKYRSIPEKIELLFLSTVSRPPTPAESKRFAAYFRGARTAEQQLEICEDIYWALINSAEFTFNH